MSNTIVSIETASLIAGARRLPPEHRAMFLATCLVGAAAMADLTRDEPATDLDEATSFSLTVEQARDLKGKLDEKTWAFIRVAVENTKDGVATIGWPEVKSITGVTNWAQFAKGRLGGLHRSLQKIAGVKNAVLVWEGEGWVEDGKGDYSAGTLVIDGVAVDALRIACGLHKGG